MSMGDYACFSQYHLEIYLISMKPPVDGLSSVYYRKRMRTSSIINWVHTNGLWGVSHWGSKLHNDGSFCMIVS